MRSQIQSGVRWTISVWVGAVVLVLLAGCGGGVKNDPILQLSAQESLKEGKVLYEAGKYGRARDYLSHAFEVEPNSVAGREALLMVADSHFADGGFDNFVKAEAKYRDFQNRFPTSERSDYVQFRIGTSLSERMERPDRDQTITRKGLDAFRDLITLFPTSEYVPQAREQIQIVRNRLAEHEYLIGHFYMRFKLPLATEGRLKLIVEEYPDFEQMDLVYFDLARAYMQTNRLDEAKATFDLLRSEYPDSPKVAEIEKWVKQQTRKMEKARKKRENAKPTKQQKKYAKMKRRQAKAEQDKAAEADEGEPEAAAGESPEEEGPQPATSEAQEEGPPPATSEEQEEGPQPQEEDKP